MILKFSFLGCTLLAIVACGGGGGGSGGGGSATNSPTSTPTNPSGGGGSTGGSTSIATGGLVSGGVAVSVNSSRSGVQLADVAVGGTGLIAGDIQVFGSIIANDIDTNTDNADFIIEGVSGSQADLKQGQQVLIIGDTENNTAAQVLYRSNVKGPVTTATIEDASIGKATFVVLGQTVTTDATTTFSNVNLADIGTNDLLEISGTVAANGQVKASFVELKATLGQFKVTGQVSAVTTTNFRIGNLTIDYSSATLRDFDSGAIADGDVVETKGDAGDFAPPSQFSASEVERLPILTVGGDASARIEGFIDRFSSATDFDVQTTSITTDANTIFVNGTVSSLALNVKVQVEGVVNGDGPVLASRVTVQLTNAIRAEGKVEAIDIAARTVTTLGVTFVLRELTRLEDKSGAGIDPFTLADLGIDDEVEIRGYLDGSTVVATRLEREDSRVRARLRGPITAENAAGGTVDILAVRVNGQSGITQYEDVNNAVITQSQFHDAVEIGDFVRARWDVYSATSEIADELTIEN